MRGTAAHVCLPLVAELVAQGPEMVQHLLTLLWDMLPGLADISAATSPVLQLLAALYGHKGGIMLSSAAEAAATQGRMRILWPLLYHSLSDVRLRAVQCCEQVTCAMAAAARQDASLVQEAACVHAVVRLVWEVMLTDPAEAVAEAGRAMLHRIATAVYPSVLAATLHSEEVGFMMCLASTHADEPLHEVHMFGGSGEPSLKRARIVHDATAVGVPRRTALGSIAGDHASADSVMLRRLWAAKTLAHFLCVLRAAGSSKDVVAAAFGIQHKAWACAMQGLTPDGGQLDLHRIAVGLLVLFFWLLALQSPADEDLASIHQWVRFPCPLSAVAPCWSRMHGVEPVCVNSYVAKDTRR